MPKILEAWEKLSVPLVYRSRFYLDLRCEEMKKRSDLDF